MPPPKKPKKNTAQRVRVRTYRYGLGDCHLVSFKKPDGKFFHMLIDCGVVDKTPNAQALMTAVAQNIAAETGGELDVVVATHQHTDHLSGFKQAQAVFAPPVGNAATGMKMKALWLAWTEDKSTGRGKAMQQQVLKTLAAVRAAAAKLAKSHSASGERVQALLNFVGPLSVAGEETQEILDLLEDGTDPTKYCEPGSVFPLPEVPNVRVYVLGPPEDPKAMRVMNPRKTKHEGYEEFALAPDAKGFMAALLPDDGESEFSFPFAPRFRKRPATARSQTFFQNHYFGRDPETKASQSWRQIDTAWLEAAEKLALYLDTFTNNTSLALAFEFIDTGEILLFPGDAQIGSWLTWHPLEWKINEANGTVRTVQTKDLFANTIFYKASHHASHNGTLSGLGEKQTGLEHMTHRDLVCVVPVDRAMSKVMHWDRTLPWEPLLKRLREITRGRLIFTDSKEKAPDSTKLTELSPAEQKRFAKRISVTNHWIDFTL
jgi:hypothetical protein